MGNNNKIIYFKIISTNFKQLIKNNKEINKFTFQIFIMLINSLIFLNKIS